MKAIARKIERYWGVKVHSPDPEDNGVRVHFPEKCALTLLSSDGIDPDRRAAAIEANRSTALRAQTSDYPDPYRHMRPYPALPK
jgi:hypothetical protein